MSNAELVQETIEKVVKQFVAERRMFTLYDVTVKVREEVGRGVSVPHYGTSGVHDAVQECVMDQIGSDPEWDRQIITPRGLAPGSARPQLYYHSSQDPDMYEVEGDGLEEYRRMRKAAGAGLAASVPSPPTVAGPAPVSTASISMNREFRVTIPASLLRKGGLKEGDAITAVADPSSRTLILTTNHTEPDAVATYHIDKRNSVRVSKGILNRAGLDGENFVVKEQGKEFVVSAGS